jgi:Na+/H+-translocating membrane pyrophosphatase
VDTRLARIFLSHTMLLRFKISLLAAFVLFTLLGMAAPSLKALLIGIIALGVSLAIAITNFLMAEHRADRELHTSR